MSIGNLPGQTSPAERNAAAIPGLAGLQPDFAAALSAMIQMSGGRIRIESGFRSNETQAKLYANAVAKYGPDGAGKWVAPPGHSNHNKGLAADLAGDIDLAHQLAPRFGLVFPMSWENWHIEPVGARDGSSPKAYTQSPFGDPNPKDDPAFFSTSNNVGALFASAMSGPVGPEAGSQAGAPAATMSAGGIGGAGASQGGGGSGSVSPTELYSRLLAATGDPVRAAAGVAIAGRESGYNAAAHNGNAGTGDNSYGLFQVNLLNGMHSQYSPQMLTTVDGSVRAFAELSAGGLNPWGGYRGDPWYKGVDLDAAVAASGGAVNRAQLEALR